MFHIAALLFSHSTPVTPVRATLEDGQILMGEVQTTTLRLQSGVGLLEIPLADIGEVVPTSGGDLGESEGRVDVWLRNGSELRGTWADPEIAMTIAVGGKAVPVDLPMNDLFRFQLQGGTQWPGGPVYRMRTSYGDDFLVDPSRTHLVLENDLGSFEPLLSECAHVAPVGDPEGPWRVQLQTGTVLLGHLRDASITVALPIGPDEISVPLAEFVSLNVESWGPLAPPVNRTAAVSVGGGRSASAAPSMRDEVSVSEAVPPPGLATPRRAEPASEGWFDNSALQATKEAQGK